MGIGGGCLVFADFFLEHLCVSVSSRADLPDPRATRGVSVHAQCFSLLLFGWSRRVIKKGTCRVGFFVFLQLRQHALPARPWARTEAIPITRYRPMSSGHLRTKSLLLCLSLPKHTLALTHVPLMSSRRQLSLRRGSGGYASAKENTDTLQPATYKPKRAEGEEKFLIANSGNDVAVLKCPTPFVLQQGLLETQGLPHICIAGESNAGKSSLINHLLHKKSLARASSVAGKTRSVDMMLVNEKLVVTDLPGLPSRDHQVAQIWEQSWRPLVFQYMNKCDSLLAMIYVHDIRWKVSSQVREFVEEVRESTGLPVLLALTKDDKIIGDIRLDPKTSNGPEALRAAEIELRERYMTRVRRALGFNGVHLHYSTNSDLPSARKARRRLLRYIESLVDAGSREECCKLLDEIASKKMASM